MVILLRADFTSNIARWRRFSSPVDVLSLRIQVKVDYLLYNIWKIDITFYN